MKQMDSGDSNEDGSKTRRRSTRQSSRTDFYSADLKPRPALKRTRKVMEEEALSRVVNGSKETTSLTERDDDESPVKIQRLQEPDEAGDGNDRGDGHQADVEMDENTDQDEDMNSDEEDEQDCGLLKFESRIDDKHAADVQEESLQPEIGLRSRRSIHKTVGPELPKPKMGQRSKYSTFRESSSLGAVPVQLKTLENLEGFERRSNTKYLDHTNVKTRDAFRGSLPESGHRHQQSEPNIVSVHHTNNLPIRQKAPQLKYSELLHSRASPASSSRGCMWYVCKLLQWSLILIGLLALSLCAYQTTLTTRTDAVKPIIKEKFKIEIAALQLRFPSQRSVFWTRSAKHLERHLQTVNPTEPVSLILTAGLKAERTLACLAQSLATAYSTSLNKSSIFEIDGTTKTKQDSDQVKLDIDTGLRKAFEGNETAAVVHRFEELPPGSTLIFYRYCDHENAAYKRVFLTFTVMLSVDKIDPGTSLSAVEDMVHDQIKEKFVSTDKSAVFNEMDVDKLSGLWSRISHVILPVSAEEKIEQQGCETY